MKSGAWELDSFAITGKGPLDGSMLVLSKEYDLDKPEGAQRASIIFERDIPPLDKPLLYFKVDARNQIGIRKDRIDTDGAWVIASSERLSMTDDDGDEIIPEPLSIPLIMHTSGFTHVNKYNIQLPVVINHDEKLERFERTEQGQELINPTLCGSEKFPGMSPNFSRIFRSQNIDFQFSINTKFHNLKRTWLLIRRHGEFLTSALLEDLLKKGQMVMEGDLYSIDLSSYLDQSGAYSLDLLHDMKPLLDEPIQFAWLPESVKISEPNPQICYSPVNPLQVSIEGVGEKEVRLIQDEKVKKTIEDDIVRLEWKILKNPHCRFDIIWDGYPIHFCWDIDRVAAWVDGGGDKNRIIEGKEKEVILQVRGGSSESFSWKVQGNENERHTHLDGRRGEFQAKLLETEVRDMLLASDWAESTVSISIRNSAWPVFVYQKESAAEIISLNYTQHNLDISTKQERKLRGEYSLQVRDVLNFERQTLLSINGLLEDSYSFLVKLEPGEYRVEISLFGKVISRSHNFQVVEELVPIQQEGGVIQSAPVYGSPQSLFKILTAPKEELCRRNHRNLAIGPSVEQLISIHDPSQWVTNDSWDPRFTAPQRRFANYPWNDSFKKLLPTWAVLRYPLRFITKTQQKVLHIFPEKVAYGARAGRGYVDLIIEGERIRAAVSWKPSGYEGYSNLWIGISQQSDIQFYSELDQNLLWPGYQCKHCGTIVASRAGDFLKLPPSLHNFHRHGEDKLIEDLFLDTVYASTDPVLVTIEQYKEEPLHHTFPVSSVVVSDYLSSLIDGKRSPGGQNQICLPIELFQNDDYKIAVDELFRHLNTTAVQGIIENSDKLNQLNQFLLDNKKDIPAFSALQRLSQAIYTTASPANIPGQILTLAMTLRMKTNLPGIYTELLNTYEFPENHLVDLLNFSVQGCPKLLEWCIAWTELFYVHAIS